MSWVFEQAMPYAAGGLYARLRQDAGAAWTLYVEHRFVAALAAGTLPLAEFQAWMVQDYFYLVHYARAYALLVYKSGSVADMRSASFVLQGLLESEMTLHRAQMASWGVGEAELARQAETLETLAYSRYVLDRAQAGDVLDLVVTLAPCLAGYAEIGLRIAAYPGIALAGHPFGAWIEAYAGTEYAAVAEQGLAQLEALAESHGAAARYPMLLQQFRQSVLLETAFWNAGRSALGQGSC